MSGGNKRGSRLLAPGLTWRFVGARASQSAEHGEKKKLNHNNNNNKKTNDSPSAAGGSPSRSP